MVRILMYTNNIIKFENVSDIARGRKENLGLNNERRGRLMRNQVEISSEF